MARDAILIRLVLGAAVWFPVASSAQQIGDDVTLKQELQRLGAQAEALDHSLPSLTCQESALSERVINGKVKQHVAFTASIRSVRSDGGRLHESFTITTLNGKPAAGKSPGLPYYTGGGFDSAMIYFIPAHQACYRYSMSAGRIDFETAPDVESLPECRNDGLHGFTLIDAEGNMTHLERTVSAEATRDFRLVPFAAIDFAPVELNGKTYRLSSHMVSDFDEGRFEATYSECKLFSVSVTMEPATPVEPGEAPEHH